MKRNWAKLGHAALMIPAFSAACIIYAAIHGGRLEWNGWEVIGLAMFAGRWFGVALIGIAIGWVALIFAKEQTAWIVGGLVSLALAHGYLYQQRSVSGSVAKQEGAPPRAIASQRAPLVVNEVTEQLPLDAANEPQPHNIVGFERLMVEHYRDQVEAANPGVNLDAMPMKIGTLRIQEGSFVMHKTTLDMGSGKDAARVLFFWGFRSGQLRRVQCVYEGHRDSSSTDKCAAQVVKTLGTPQVFSTEMQ